MSHSGEPGPEGLPGDGDYTVLGYTCVPCGKFSESSDRCECGRWHKRIMLASQEGERAE